MLSAISTYERKGNDNRFCYTGGAVGQNVPFDFTGGQMKALDNNPFVFNGKSPSNVCPDSSSNGVKCSMGSSFLYTGEKRKRGKGRKAKKEGINYSFPITSPIGPIIPIRTVPRKDKDSMCSTDCHPMPAWYSGCAPLGIHHDKSFLYKIQTYLRSNVVEVFGATEQDIISAPLDQNQRKKMLIGRVGIRCKHCKEQSWTARGQHALSFPNLLSDVYSSVQEIFKLHFDSCPSMPDEVRHKIDTLRVYSPNLGPREWYWIDSAKQLGLLDTPHGIHFGRDPNGPLPKLRGPSAAYMGFTEGQTEEYASEETPKETRLLSAGCPILLKMPYIYRGGDIDEGCGNVPKDVVHVIVHNQVTHIDGGAFRSCKTLTTIEISDSVTIIGVRAFEGCTNLTSVHLPESVTSVGHCAFSGCIKLTTVNVPDSLHHIGAGAFQNCRRLNVVAAIPTTDFIMEEKASGRCHTLPKTGEDGDPHFATRVTICSSAVGRCAFSGCVSLSSVTLPSGITALGTNAFRGCSSLSSIQLPTNLIGFTSNAFDGCSVSGVIHAQTTPPFPIVFTDDPVTFEKSLAKIDFIPGSLDDLLYNRPKCITPDAPDEMYYHKDIWMAWARTRDADARLPLTIAAARSLEWKANMEEIFSANMPATYEVDAKTGLSLFMLAAVGPSSKIESVYHLLREFPPAVCG